MKTSAIVLILALGLVGCMDNSDKFHLGDDVVTGDNSQVSISVEYPREVFYTPVGGLLNITPTTKTVGIYDTDFVFTIFPSLPSSFSFNPATGEIYGIPLDYQQNISYIVTATKAQYSSTALITLNFVPPMSNPSYGMTNLDFSVNESTSYTPISNPGATSYSVSPTTLPDGITFNTATGTFTGNPTTVSGFGEFDTVTVTAFDYNGESLSRVLSLTRVPQLVASLVMTPIQTLGVTGGNLIDLSGQTAGGRGVKAYSIASGGGHVSANGIYTTPNTAGVKSVSVRDLNGAGSVVTLQFEVSFPQMSVADVIVSNPSGASTELLFSVALNGSSLSSTSFSYQTIDDTDPRCLFTGDRAVNGLNYSAVSGTLVMDPGTSVKQISVPILREPGLAFSKRFCIVVTPGIGGTSSTEEIIAIATIIP